ncbi:hypothetical protein HY844_00255 [Candidatus Berkelbacteria bacterium]|nr:hypothetical protein [Candidatus Berkelbacteria bacterium]
MRRFFSETLEGEPMPETVSVLSMRRVNSEFREHETADEVEFSAKVHRQNEIDKLAEAAKDVSVQGMKIAYSLRNGCNCYDEVRHGAVLFVEIEEEKEIFLFVGEEGVGPKNVMEVAYKGESLVATIISAASPIGKALRGKRAKEQFVFACHIGTCKGTILEIA